MTATIVIALGPATAAPYAWQEAAVRARRDRANLVAVRGGGEAIGDSWALLRAARDELAERADELCGQARLEVVVGRGALADELATVAASDRADLVVVGADLFSPAELVTCVDAVLARTGCTVLITRAGPATGILVGGVGSDDRADVVAAALRGETAARYPSFPILVQCLPPAEAAEAPARTGADAGLRALLWRWGLAGTAVVAVGPPRDALIASAAELQAELLIVGAARAAGTRRPRLGTTAAHAIVHAPCSVAVVARGAPLPLDVPELGDAPRA